MPFLYGVSNVKLKLCAKRISLVPAGNTPEKKTFSISIKVDCRKYVFKPKILIGSFFLEENILGINKGIIKLFNSLTKSVFEIKTYFAFSIASLPYRMDVLL